VVHVIVSDVFDTLVAVTAVITGAPVELEVVNVAFGEVAETLDEFADTTSKL
jgi:hypothetical protein